MNFILHSEHVCSPDPKLSFPHMQGSYFNAYKIFYYVLRPFFLSSRKRVCEGNHCFLATNKKGRRV
jgi:hypothetical protein